ncbi:MAG: Uncharacterized protein Athens101428_477 [Candidatus Berkelbacteria bacterium Athens1014_28]|uniref:Uncharacterized protein n=1 Tax=Candidatus Berkelbacteria bacterium Athens1014_28 TaxID=2017145 RepID=A0A554LME0_9BACT|nr:MAG: Uncharacterized protein Athens101428_477 [Candidatus Berkelbacteria bacterium Athens1014_28]
MIPYKTKVNKVSGSNLGEVYKSAWKFFHQIEKSTKRKAYIRSTYFKKDKVFFDFYWAHLKDKSPKERFKRLQFFAAAIEVVKNSTSKPSIKINPNKKSEILYRFAGLTKSGELFIVQVKENKISKRKYLMSCFPVE